MSLLKKLAGETAIYGISSILSRILHYLLLTPYLTRVFVGEDTEQYGIHGIMYSFAALLMVLFTYRMETAFFRFGSRKGNLSTTFSTASVSILFTTAFFVFLLLFFSEPIAATLTRPEDARYVRWFAFIVGFDALAAIPFAKLRLENRPVRFAVIKTLNILITIAIIFFFLELCPVLIADGSDFASWLYEPDKKLDYIFLSNVAASGIVLIFLIPEYLGIRIHFEAQLWRKMFRYALPLIIVGIAGVINQLLDRYLLKELLPGTTEENLAQVGLYNGCVKIAVLMNLFIQAFNYAAEPFFFKHADRVDSKSIYANIAHAFTLVGSLVFLGIMLYIDIVQLIIGADYREAISIVPLLLLAYLFLGLYYNFSIWYKLSDKTIFGAYISVGGAIITLSLNILLIPEIGYMGSAWAALACFLFMAAASYFTGQKYYPIHYPVSRMVAHIALAVIVFLGSEYLRSPEYSTLHILVQNTCIFIGYLIIVYAMEAGRIKGYLKQV